MADAAERIHVEVAYALPGEQKIVGLDVAPGTTAYEAAVCSGIDRLFAEIDLDDADMGVFGKVIKAKDYELADGDRVEIYRPLIADPKEARKKRAAKRA